MAKTVSIIRYKYKADRDFESVQFEGMSCSLGELKRLIIEKSSRSGAHHPKDDYDLIISNATTHEEYKDYSDMIPRNTSVVVARRIRGSVESLTPSTNPKPVISSDDIVNEYLRPAIHQPTPSTTNLTTNTSVTMTESKAIPLETLTKSSNTTSTQEKSEDERIKELVKSSKSRYLFPHRSATSYTCHNCKQSGHLRNQCPLLLSSSGNSTANTIGSSSSATVDHSSKNDNTQSTGSMSSAQSVPHSSHIVTHKPSYQRSHHRRPGYSRNESIPKPTTGIPRDRLIQIPGHIPGAFRDPTGAPVVPRQMAQLFVERSERKADALAQRARQFQEKGVLPPAPSSSILPTKSSDDETPPDDLLCPLCKQVYTDAVITPCCHNSFCDECIRTALIESEEHECPHCHRQHVAIDQINPNLFLRKYVNRWYEERQHKSSYPNISLSQHSSTINYSSISTFEQNLDSVPLQTSNITNTQNSNDTDEYDAAIVSTNSQQSNSSNKTGPIIIKMQPLARSPSPQPIVSTKSADMIFEDGKAPDTDQTALSQKDANSELSTKTDTPITETVNTVNDTNTSENDKSDRLTPPSQVAPLSTILSSPPTTTTTTMATATTSVVPPYYPVHPHIPPHQQPIHHGMIHPQQIPPTSTNTLYPIQPNFYQPAMHIPYLGSHHPASGAPIIQIGGGGGVHHYPGHPPFPAVHHPPRHPIGHPHVPVNPLNGYHVPHFEAANVPSVYHPNEVFSASSSTLISHQHQTLGQSLQTPLSKDEFYMKQRHLQRIKRSTSRRYSRSRSSSYSSSTSSVSRSSSFSRRRRSSRSRSRRRINERRRSGSRTLPPNRDYHRQRRRSPSPRDRRRAPITNNNYSSKYRRPSPRPYRSIREEQRRRSPRPPPTLQQSIQRTIVYMHESSSSKHSSDRDRDHHRSKSNSRHRSRVNDDRIAPSSKTEQQSESIRSSSPMTVPSDKQRPRLSSIVEAENLSVPLLSNSSFNTRSIEKNSISRTNDNTEDKNLDSDKKRKKHHHHHQKKHRRHQSRSPDSKSRKHQSKEKDLKTTIVNNETTNSSNSVQVQ